METYETLRKELEAFYKDTKQAWEDEFNLENPNVKLARELCMCYQAASGMLQHLKNLEVMTNLRSLKIQNME